MSTNSRSSGPHDPRLDRILAEYVESVESGSPQNPDDWAARYPEFAAELRDFIAVRRQFDAAVQNAAEELSPSAFDSPTLLGQGNAREGSGESAAPPRVRYFGDYELLEEIARGGMGVVYKARQVNLKRIVALKLILSGQLAGEEDVRRFHAEAEAAAKLDHPNIVPIFEIGQHQGQHYFSMAYVEGESLARKLVAGPLPPRAAAQLMKKVADAITFAHIEGVVHRDLKPANVLLDKDGEPRVTDFGLAKRISTQSLAGNTQDSAANLTATGQILGTPSYMPPEQASGKTDDVGPLADVYSLGALLYCLLTGRPPFQAASPIDTLLQVRHQEPVPVRQLDSKVPRDLETICLKCLEKDPGRRYAGARQFADDLERYLANEPIQARRAGAAERLGKWVRRHPAWAALVGVIGVGAMTALGSAAWYVRDLRDRHVQSLLQQAHLTRLGGDVDGAYTLVREAAQSRRDLSVRQVAMEAIIAPHSRSLHWLPFGERIVGAIFSDDGRRLVAAGIVQSQESSPRATEIARVKVWDTHSGQLLGELDWDPSGRIMPAVSSTGDLLAVPQVDGAISLWAPETGKIATQLPRTAPLTAPLAFSSDGKWLVVAEPHNLHVWNCRTGEKERKRPTATFLCFAGNDAVWVRERGDAGVPNDWEGRLARWRLNNDSLEPFGPEDMIPLALSADGRRAALRHLKGAPVLAIFDLTSGERLTDLSTVGHAFAMVKFSADGNRFVVQLPMEEPDSLRVYEVSTDAGLVREYPGYLRTISEPYLRLVRPSLQTDLRHARQFDERSPLADLGAEFVGDRPLLAVSIGQALSVTNVRTGEVSRLAPNGTDGVAAWSADGSQFAFVRSGAYHNYGNGVVFYQDDRGRLIQFAGPKQLGGRPPTGGTVNSTSGAILQVRGLVECAEASSFYGEDLLFHPGGELLVSSHQLWRFRRDAGRINLEPHLASDSYGRIRFVSHDEVWSTQLDSDFSRLLLKKLPPDPREIAVAILRGSVSTVAFSHDGLRAFVASQQVPAAGGEPRMVYQLWDLSATDKPAAEWEPAATAQPNGAGYRQGGVSDAAFSPDGQMLATSAFVADGIELWDIATHTRRRRLPVSGGQTTHLAFTSDGRYIVASHPMPGLLVWDTTSGSHRIIGKDVSAQPPFAISADGHTLASQGKSGIHLWSLPEGRELARWDGGGSAGTAMAFHPDGKLLATCGGGHMNNVRFWDLAAIRAELAELGLDW